MIRVSCDGSTRPQNPGHSGLGTVIVWEDGIQEQFSEYLGDQITNNIAEIKAFEKALDILIERGKEWEEIEVTVDSKYVEGIFSKGWNAKANVDLVAQVRRKLENFPNLHFNWVKGHQNNPLNELADKLAGEAVSKVLKKML